jgi:chromosome segregation ATPase
MSDDGALSGAVMLSQQLRMYRWADTLDRARFNNELAVDNALLRREAEELVARYNQLVAQANELYRHATEVASDGARKDTVIAQLERAKTALEAECEQLRLELRDKATQIALLREIVRQDHPDRYLPE